MKKITLSGKRSKGKFALVDDEDYEWANKYKWCWYSRNYVARSVYIKKSGRKNQKNIHYKLARMIIKCPKNKIVDHKDCDPLNNQKSNLRICTIRQNNLNKPLRSDNTSGYKGVSWSKIMNKWIAQINNKVIGYFDSKLHAAMAYDIWAKHSHGEFARLNFIVVEGLQ